MKILFSKMNLNVLNFTRMSEESRYEWKEKVWRKYEWN